MDNMPRCRDCRFWDRESDTMGRCDLASSEDGKPAHADTLAVAVDPDEYRAWLETKPDFGCVQFKLKDSTA